MSTFDIYPILTTLFAACICLGLIAFKLSLKQEPPVSHNSIEKIRQKQMKKSQSNEEPEKSIWQTNTFLKTYAYLVKNHTFLEMCMTRRAKNKLPILLSITLIGILSLFLPHAYYLCIVGLVLVPIFVISQSFFQRDPEDILQGQEQFAVIREQVKNQSQREKKKNIIYSIFTAAICGTSLFICGSIYQNYFNSFLEIFAITFVVNSTLDIFVVRPVGFLLLSLPLKFNLRVQYFIYNQNIRAELLQISTRIQIKQCAANSPRKKQTNSPTKVPKAILRLSKQNSENQTLINALDMIKKIKKQKNNQFGLMTPLGKNNKVGDSDALEEYSLNQLFNEQDKSAPENILQKTPIAHFNFDQDSSCNHSRVKGKKRDSELIIVQFKNRNSQGSQIQDQDEPEKQEPLNFMHSNLDEEDISEIAGNNKNQGDDQQNSKIRKLFDNKSLDQGSDDGESSYTKNSRNNQNFLTIQPKNNGLMSINEQGDQQRQIEQIDLNSPTKKKSKLNGLIDDSQTRLPKSKKAKYASNANKRVIKFTSGEPYLQYLPNMLSKQTNKHTKRSQPINFKNQFQLFQQKPARKSLKKIRKEHKIDLGNNENECPDAMYIEDL